MYASDPEGAHGLEDALLEEFVRQTSRREPDAGEIIRLLDTKRRRWYG
jgi:hypothetical protein